MEKMIIGKKEYPVYEKEIDQNQLLFYYENPRIYSQLYYEAGKTPSQEEIEELMVSFDHVKQLRLSIESNGGLIDPLIVRDGDFIVLEGNSRLAAYRMLRDSDPLNPKWHKIKCKILPKDFDNDAIFNLLGQYHIIGKKDWSPFEQAGYLYRRHKETKIPISEMAQELGITKGVAEKYIEVYEFMRKKSDIKQNHWSAYEEYIKNAQIRKIREEDSRIDKVICKAIINETLEHASDIRKLGKIAELNNKKSNKLIKNIIEEKIDFVDAYDELKDSGAFDDALSKVKKLSAIVLSNDDDFKNKIINSDKSGEIKFELKKIVKELKDIIDLI